MIPPALIKYPQIDPFMFRIGKVGLSWYAFVYILGFVIGYFVVRHRYRTKRLKLEHPEDLGLLASYCFYGVILGARLIYILFYNLSYFLKNPLQIPAIWHGGMSFHGGVLGAIVAVYLFSKRHHASFFQIMDIIALVAPVALGLGRIANFINGELYGRVTDVPWAMIFPRGGPYPRHPSQLYESFFEGPVLFFILWWVDRKKWPQGSVSAIFILTYGLMRFFLEFFREPDSQLGTVLGPFSMGQLLCFAMILGGIGMLAYFKRYSWKMPN